MVRIGESAEFSFSVSRIPDELEVEIGVTGVRWTATGGQYPLVLVCEVGVGLINSYKMTQLLFPLRLTNRYNTKLDEPDLGCQSDG